MPQSISLPIWTSLSVLFSMPGSCTCLTCHVRRGAEYPGQGAFLGGFRGPRTVWCDDGKVMMYVMLKLSITIFQDLIIYSCRDHVFNGINYLWTGAGSWAMKWRMCVFESEGWQKSPGNDEHLGLAWFHPRRNYEKMNFKNNKPSCILSLGLEGVQKFYPISSMGLVYLPTFTMFYH